MFLMVGGQGWRWWRAGGPWGRRLRGVALEWYGREKMRGEGGALLAERVGRVVVGLVTCQGSCRGRMVLFGNENGGFRK